MVDFFKALTGKTKDELVRPEIQALRRRGNVQWSEMDRPMNSYERDELLPALTDDAFLRLFVHCAKNVAWSGRSAGEAGYDYAVSVKYAPEAERRGIGVSLEETPEYAELGVSLPIARIEALRRIVKLVVPYSRGMPVEVLGEVNRLFLLAKLDALYEEAPFEKLEGLTRLERVAWEFEASKGE
jgi:hypothetical protein